jgi:hypothetical protein
VFLVISSILATMWRAAAARRHLLRPEIDDEQIQAILRGAAPNIGLHAVRGFPGSAAGERAVQMLTAGDPELGKDLVEVVLDGARTDEQTGADLGI